MILDLKSDLLKGPDDDWSSQFFFFCVEYLKEKKSKIWMGSIDFWIRQIIPQYQYIFFTYGSVVFCRNFFYCSISAALKHTLNCWCPISPIFLLCELLFRRLYTYFYLLDFLDQLKVRILVL